MSFCVNLCNSINKDNKIIVDKIKNKMDLYLVININNINFGDITRYVYSQYSIEKILYKNKEYRETISYYTMNNILTVNRPEHDKNKICECMIDYRTDEQIKYEIIPNNVFDIKYIYFKDSSSLYDNEFENIELINKMRKMEDITNVKFIGYKNIKFTNISGINYDHRGSNHTNIYLPFEESTMVKLPITLDVIIDKLFRLKSNKFDKWYELYVETIVKKNKKKDIIYINVKFDHGS